jgi:hypothetical protein
MASTTRRLVEQMRTGVEERDRLRVVVDQIRATIKALR